MPPKRKAPTKPTSSTTTTAAKPRLSKLAKQNDITNEQEREVADAFALFARHDIDDYEKENKTHGVIESECAVRVLTALGISISTTEAKDIHETLDPDDEGYITYQPFLAYAAIRLNQQAEAADSISHAQEVQSTFALFTKNNTGPITVAHLKRVAKTIREDVDDETLKEMVMEANGTARDGWKSGVSLEQFEAVLRRAGVYS